MLFSALLALALQSPDSSRDSVYSTRALRDFVAKAAVANRAPPPELLGYTATVESELALILLDSIGRETVGQIEQLAARAEWERNGRYDLRVVGYRAQSMGAPYSALTFTRMYSVPTLYGNRLAFGMNDGLRTTTDDAARRRRVQRDSAAGRTPYRLIHPLAADRDRFYRFTGGDTAAILYASGRAIRLVRVMVEPVGSPGANFEGFRGELDFDAGRHQLVRMRGRFERISPRKDPLIVRSTGAVAIAFVEFENAEIGGKYWLPNVQRSEFQAQMGLLGDTRPIYRIVTRFRGYRTRDSVMTLADVDSIRSLPPTRASLTFAKGDSVSGYAGWESNLGTLSGKVSGTDFDDLAPDVWKPTGRPRTDFWPRKLEDVVRYNRVEGLFTGVSGTVRFRDKAPGLTARGTAGWAWTEQTARGSGSVSLARGSWITGARVERTLSITNDYLIALESGLSIGPLISGTDDYDYVDRRAAALSVTRVFRDVDRAMLTTELAMVTDRNAPARLGSAVFHSSPFRINRVAESGSYGRVNATLEYHPRVNGETLAPGIGARVKYELASGDLDWQRVDVRLSIRKYWRGLVLASRLDAGSVFGSAMPPQAMYEMGGGMDLPSYGYKEFGGDRAALGRGLAAYYLPVLRKPARIGWIMIPGLSPGIGAGLQGGWTEISSDAARRAMLALGGDGVTPLSRATGGVRATADFRLTILSGAIGAGIARPLDENGRWKPYFVWGAAF